MQAERAIPVEPMPWPEPVAAPRPAPRLPMASSGAVASPALLLREELAARLATIYDAPAHATDTAIYWPPALRLLVITGLSFACWGAILVTAISIF